MKRVTESKLVAASRALLALVECDDIDDVCGRFYDALVARLDHDDIATEAHHEIDRHHPQADRLVRLAQMLSLMAVPDGEIEFSLTRRPSPDGSPTGPASDRR